MLVRWIAVVCVLSAVLAGCATPAPSSEPAPTVASTDHPGDPTRPDGPAPVSPTPRGNATHQPSQPTDPTDPAPPQPPPPPASPGSYPTFADPPIAMSANPAYWETSLAVTPDGSTVLACDAEVGNGQPPPLYFLSRDSGQSWADVLQVTGPTDQRSSMTGRGQDCDVASDSAGTLYVADPWDGGIEFMVSKDGGQTWSQGATTVGSGIAGTSLPIPVTDPLGPTMSFMRPWLAGGPAGTIHMVYEVNKGQSTIPDWAIMYARSTDYGLTFSTPVTVTDDDTAFAGALSVSPDGRHLAAAYGSRSPSEAFMVGLSDDAGATWTPVTAQLLPSGARGREWPSVSRDAGGIFHMVFGITQGNSPENIAYTRSLDGGRTWTAMANLSPGMQAFAPWVAAGKKGQAVVAWEGLTGPPEHQELRVYWSRITDASGTAPPTQQTAATTKDPLLVGSQDRHILAPEYGTVRLDKDGSIRLGFSIGADSLEWRAYYQEQTGGPAT